VVVLGGLVALVVRGARRAPLLPPVVTRRRLVPVGVAAALVSLAGAVNGLPAALAGWASDTPWPTFVGETALAVVVGAVVSGLVAATLLAAWTRYAVGPAGPSGLRPTPRHPSPARGGRRPCSSGAALGLRARRARPARARRQAGSWPAAPSTTLDALAPWAASALRAVQGLVWAPAAALPVAAVAAGLRGARARLLALGAAGLVAGAALAVGGAGGEVSGPLAVAAGLIGLAVTALAVWAFGRGSALAWLAAPPAGAVAASLADARAAANGADLAAAVLGALAGGALLAALYRWAVRAGAAARPNARGGAAARPRPRASRPAAGLPFAAREERQAEVDPEAARLALEPVPEVGLGAERDVGAVRDLDAHARADVRVVQVVAGAAARPVDPTNGRKYDTAARFATSVMRRAGRKWYRPPSSAW
jgi:hypothetical protein